MTNEPIAAQNYPYTVANFVTETTLSLTELRQAVEILEREFGHGDAIHNAAALEALACLREMI